MWILLSKVIFRLLGRMSLDCLYADNRDKVSNWPTPTSFYGHLPTKCWLHNLQYNPVHYRLQLHRHLSAFNSRSAAFFLQVSFRGSFSIKEIIVLADIHQLHLRRPFSSVSTYKIDWQDKLKIAFLSRSCKP
jgi:hypothetical protein